MTDRARVSMRWQPGKVCHAARDAESLPLCSTLRPRIRRVAEAGKVQRLLWQPAILLKLAAGGLGGWHWPPVGLVTSHVLHQKIRIEHATLH